MLKLTNKQILEAFPDECEKLAPKVLRERKRQMQELANIMQEWRIKYNIVTYNFLCQLLYFEVGQEIEQNIKRLKSLAFTKLALDGKMKNAKYYDLETVKSIPIETLHTFQKVRDTSKRVHCACPFHYEKHPSFTIYKETNTFYCFSCQSGSSNIDFVMKLYEFDFKSAVEFLVKL